jgi:Lysylphosphatidylglycerol synthase TM region
MTDGPPDAALELSEHGSATHHNRLALGDAKRHLQKSALKLVGYVVAAYLVLRLIPTLERGLHSLEHVSGAWLAGAIALEVISESGFVVAWREIVDPERVLERDGRGRRMDQRVAWAQLGGGLVVPGGTLGGMGVGAWFLHRFGMPGKRIAERQFTLSFLNTTISAFALIVFGVGLAAHIFHGKHGALLTLLPAAVAAIGLAGAVWLATRARGFADRAQATHPKIASALNTLADAVAGARGLFHRGSLKSVLGAVTYLGFEILVLWSAFLAIHADPAPGFAVVAMAYVIGALGGSLPLPASIGTIGGIAGMLVVYGVDHNPAVAAVLLHQAIGLLVPLTGGTIAYVLIRRRLGPLRTSAGVSSA